MAASLAELERALDELELDGVALPTHTEGLYLGDEKLSPLLEALDAQADEAEIGWAVYRSERLPSLYPE